MKYQSSHKMWYRLPSIASKKVKQVTTMESVPKIKTCDKTTKEMMRRIFNEVTKQEDCTPETWRRIRIKVICEKGNVEDVGNTARCALCQHFKCCTQQSYTTDFTTGLAVRNQGGFRRSYQTPDHLATYRPLETENAGSGVSKCGSRQWTS